MNLYQLQNRWDDQRARDRLEPILQDVRRQAREDLRYGPRAFVALTICTLAAAALSRGLGA